MRTTYVNGWPIDVLVTQPYGTWIPVETSPVSGSFRKMYIHSLHGRFGGWINEVRPGGEGGEEGTCRVK